MYARTYTANWNACRPQQPQGGGLTKRQREVLERLERGDQGEADRDRHRGPPRRRLPDIERLRRQERRGRGLHPEGSAAASGQLADSVRSRGARGDGARASAAAQLRELAPGGRRRPAYAEAIEGAIVVRRCGPRWPTSSGASTPRAASHGCPVR